MRAKQRTYTVSKDNEIGDWRVVAGKTCVLRTFEKNHAVREARAKAQVAAQSFGVNTRLKVLDRDGNVLSEQSWKANS